MHLPQTARTRGAGVWGINQTLLGGQKWLRLIKLKQKSP